MELPPLTEKKKWTPFRRERSRKAKKAEEVNLEQSKQNYSGVSPNQKNGGIGIFGRSRRIKVVVSPSKGKASAPNCLSKTTKAKSTGADGTATIHGRRPTPEKNRIPLTKVLSGRQDTVTTDSADSTTDHSSIRGDSFKQPDDSFAEVSSPREEQELRVITNMDTGASYVPEISDEIVSEATPCKVGTPATRLIDRIREDRKVENDSAQTTSFIPLTSDDMLASEGSQACAEIYELSRKLGRGMSESPRSSRNLFHPVGEFDGWRSPDNLSSTYFRHTRSSAMLENAGKPMDRATCLAELASLKKQLEEEEKRCKVKLAKKHSNQSDFHCVNKKTMSDECVEASIGDNSLVSPTTINVSYGRSRTLPAPALYYEKFFAQSGWKKSFTTRDVSIGTTVRPRAMNSAPSDEDMEQDVNAMLAYGESRGGLGVDSGDNVDKQQATFYDSDTDPFYGLEEARKIALAIALKNTQPDADKNRNSSSSVASNPTPSQRSSRGLFQGKTFLQKLRKGIEKKERQNENGSTGSLDDFVALAKENLNKMATARASGNARNSESTKNKSQISNPKGERQVTKKLLSMQCSVKKNTKAVEGAERAEGLSGVELDKSSPSDLLRKISIVEDIPLSASIDDNDDEGSFSDGDSISDRTDYCSDDDTYSTRGPFEKAEIPRLLSSVAESIHRTVSWSTGIDLNLEPSESLLSEFSGDITDNEPEDVVFSRSSSFASSKESVSCNNLYDFRRFACM